MNAIESNRFSLAWAELASSLPEPAAILCLSAHWETEGPRVTAMERPPTIHDFQGFPSELTAIQYSAPGSPELAQRLIELAPEIRADWAWGLDHGCWSVLRAMWPDATIPVVQLSLDRGLTPAQHFELGQSLAPLRQEGVLLLGSGNLVHNLTELIWADEAHPWAQRVDQRFAALLRTGELEPLLDPWAMEAEAPRALPTLEHYLPLLYVLGMRAQGEPLRMFNEEVTLGAIGMRSVVLGQQSTFDTQQSGQGVSTRP